MNELRGIARRALGAVFVVASIAAMVLLLDEGRTMRRAWTFVDDEAEGLVPRVPEAGAWGIVEHPTATGGRALQNGRGAPDAPPSLMLAEAVRGRDVRATTRCTSAPLASCGIAFRVRGDDDYRLARVDLAEHALEVVAVEGGRERQLARVAVDLAPEWQTLKLEVRGDRVRVECNGDDVLVAADALAGVASGVGLWAPSSAAVLFDALELEALSPAPQALEIVPVVSKPNG